MPKLTFGKLLRQKRIEADKSMGQLARHLGITVPYLSDVERENRGPLTTERIIASAEFLSADPDALLGAAAEWKGSFELDARGISPKAREVGAALQRGWTDLSDSDLEKIEKMLGRR